VGLTKRRRGRPPARESAALKAEFGDARVIRRYGNRRLYDTRLSRCVKLEEIAMFVRAGEDVRVLAAEGGEDITRRILGQILLEDSNRERLAAMPIDLLRQMIAVKDDTMLAWLEQYLAAGAKWLERQTATELGEDMPMLPPEVLVPATPVVRSARA
jgi:polyhydroxyalkanoate synthesis repressor PhaR